MDRRTPPGDRRRLHPPSTRRAAGSTSPCRKDPRQHRDARLRRALGYEGPSIYLGPGSARRCRPLQPVVLPQRRQGPPGGGRRRRRGCHLKAPATDLSSPWRCRTRRLRPADAAARRDRRRIELRGVRAFYGTAPSSPSAALPRSTSGTWPRRRPGRHLRGGGTGVHRGTGPGETAVGPFEPVDPGRRRRPGLGALLPPPMPSSGRR